MLGLRTPEQLDLPATCDSESPENGVRLRCPASSLVLAPLPMPVARCWHSPYGLAAENGMDTGGESAGRSDGHGSTTNPHP